MYFTVYIIDLRRLSDLEACLVEVCLYNRCDGLPCTSGSVGARVEICTADVIEDWVKVRGSWFIKSLHTQDVNSLPFKYSRRGTPPSCSDQHLLQSVKCPQVAQTNAAKVRNFHVHRNNMAAMLRM